MNKDRTKQLILIGAGGHAKVVLETLSEADTVELYFLDADPEKKEKSIFGVPVLGFDDLLPELTDARFLVTLGHPLSRRRDLFYRATECGLKQCIRIHHSATVSRKASWIGGGTVILPRTVINPDAIIGLNCIINTGAIVEHDCKVGDHSHIAPGAILCGGVTIGEEVLVGAGAVVLPGAVVPDGFIVPAGSVWASPKGGMSTGCREILC